MIKQRSDMPFWNRNVSADRIFACGRWHVLPLEMRRMADPGVGAAATMSGLGRLRFYDRPDVARRPGLLPNERSACVVTVAVLCRRCRRPKEPRVRCRACHPATSPHHGASVRTVRRTGRGAVLSHPAAAAGGFGGGAAGSAAAGAGGRTLCSYKCEAEDNNITSWCITCERYAEPVTQSVFLNPRP